MRVEKWIEEFFSSIRIYIPVIFISILAGIVKLLNSNGEISKFGFFKEIFTSVFCGLIIFLLIKETNKVSYSIALAISGWVAYKSIKWLNSIFEKKVGTIIGFFNRDGKK